MKKLSLPLLTLLLCLTSAVSFSQQPTIKPQLFAAFPDKINVSDAVFKNAFTTTPGQDVSITFGDGLVFTGKVIANGLKYSNLSSLTIKSPAYDNAFLSISRITNEDQSITYTGRIINSRASDGYEIKRDATGNYRLQKFETNRILQDCNY